MTTRLELHKILVDILGSEHVYYQPPPNVMLEYPCIVYKWDNTYRANGDNLAYMFRKRYLVTSISKDPDSIVPDKLAQLPMTTHSMTMVADNLNHVAFDVYF